MGDLTIRADSLDDVRLLASCFATVPAEDEWKIAATVYDLGLMQVRNFRLGLWLIRRLRGREGVFNFFRQLSLRSPQTISQFVIDTADHIVHGRDREDDNSVGGFSQREIDLLLARIKFSRLHDLAHVPSKRSGE